MSKKENNRFEIVYEDKGLKLKGCRILKDRVTGVLYLFHFDGYAGGLTVMLDRDGKPLVDTKENTQ
jgi:hypothetical protein